MAPAWPLPVILCRYKARTASHQWGWPAVDAACSLKVSDASIRCLIPTQAPNHLQGILFFLTLFVLVDVCVKHPRGCSRGHLRRRFRGDERVRTRSRLGERYK